VPLGKHEEVTASLVATSKHINNLTCDMRRTEKIVKENEAFFKKIID
jgi:hypothetical protein